MTATLFLAFVLFIAFAVVALVARYLGRRAAVTVGCCLLAWLIYVGVMGYTGVVRNTAIRPPGIVFVLFPVSVFLVFFIVRVRSSAHLALAFPLWIVMAAQSFRLGVELFLHQLWIEGLVPKMLTFEGANLDIYVGASAALIAWLSTRGRSGLKLALVWNVLGLLVLANTVVRAVLTAPGPANLLHTEVPNRMIGTFPYMLIPAFFVPLAVVLHVLALQAIRGRLGAAVPVAHNTAETSQKPGRNRPLTD